MPGTSPGMTVVGVSIWSDKEGIGNNEFGEAGHGSDPASDRRLRVARQRDGGFGALAAALVAGTARRDRSGARRGARPRLALGGHECGGFPAAVLPVARRRDPRRAGGWVRAVAAARHRARALQPR